MAGVSESGSETSFVSIKCENVSSLGEDPLTSQAGHSSKDLFGNRQ